MAAARRLELVVVRHGLTAWNLEGRYQGQRDIPLLLPDALPDMERLRDHLAGETFDAVYCSDLTRCRQTLAHVWAGEESMVRFDARLRELDFGVYEGRTWEELQDDAGYRAWIDSAGEQAPLDGESSTALWARLSSWLEELLSTVRASGQRRVLAVSHGGVIRQLRWRLGGGEFWTEAVGQAEGRRFMIDHGEAEEAGNWRCSASSVVPTRVDAG